LRVGLVTVEVGDGLARGMEPRSDRIVALARDLVFAEGHAVAKETADSPSDLDARHTR
jgi:hypothetical protein